MSFIFLDSVHCCVLVLLLSYQFKLYKIVVDQQAAVVEIILNFSKKNIF